MLEGIQFVTNAAGKKTAVLIDLKLYGELWEDFYDALIARQRADEPRESLESVREALERQGIPQVYAMTSIVVCGLVSLLFQWVYNLVSFPLGRQHD